MMPEYAISVYVMATLSSIEEICRYHTIEVKDHSNNKINTISSVGGYRSEEEKDDKKN